MALLNDLDIVVDF